MNTKSILDLKSEEIEKSFRVNLLSHYHTIQAFLPGMLEAGRGTVVTVASVLGHLGCANLCMVHFKDSETFLLTSSSADYTAAKAGLLALHASLRAELSHSKDPAAQDIRTVLVAPGQLDTQLFSGLTTPSNFLAPVVEPVQLAREVVKMVDSGHSGEVLVPLYAKWVPLLAALPSGMQRILRTLSGMDTAMLNLSKRRNA
jgi:NAD(P)-dependent dehydrogenase (short-subunit alcohol dehydrogenase family)